MRHSSSGSHTKEKVSTKGGAHTKPKVSAKAASKLKGGSHSAPDVSSGGGLSKSTLIKKSILALAAAVGIFILFNPTVFSGKVEVTCRCRS